MAQEIDLHVRTKINTSKLILTLQKTDTIKTVCDNSKTNLKQLKGNVKAFKQDKDGSYTYLKQGTTIKDAQLKAGDCLHLDESRQGMDIR